MIAAEEVPLASVVAHGGRMCPVNRHSANGIYGSVGSVVKLVHEPIWSIAETRWVLLGSFRTFITASTGRTARSAPRRFAQPSFHRPSAALLSRSVAGARAEGRARSNAARHARPTSARGSPGNSGLAQPSSAGRGPGLPLDEAGAEGSSSSRNRL